ncbi:hypothetical protein DL767_000298 [Monosporascus sp. MG133]|nr:hypothetical protein DL767_000298 [Monosporascus sp. MG133]
MPPKIKGASKAKATTESKEEQASPPPPPPRTPNKRSWQRYWATNPHQKAFEELGPHGMSPAALQAYNNAEYVKPGVAADVLSKKAQKELWKQANEASLPLRRLPRPRPFQWGRDAGGRDRGEYASIEDFDARRAKEDRLFLLQIRSDRFRNRRTREKIGFVRYDTGESVDYGCSEEDIEAERVRRKEMADLRMELYGVRQGSYALDPEWDDVAPIPQAEPEGALAAIAYPDDYAESMSYLRAVMAEKEHSPRCLRLTEHIISMNPAHYTVWLYRFAIVEALNISIPDEIEWLNAVSLEHLKNYQIWHHRQLLLDHYYPAIASSADDVKDLARSELDFVSQMLALDAKNYHVWSYRQYLVRKLGAALWPSNDPGYGGDEEGGGAELSDLGRLIDEDVRNNSAWSHRFFVVFSDPGRSTPASHATERDPAVPAAVIDRELAYARQKIDLAPQNQSPWNYLRGVLAKGGRGLSEVRAFAEGYVKALGEEGEVVRSSHALDYLADAYKEAGDRERADLCLRRLAEKWDRVRRGYWEYRRRMLDN